MKDERKKTKWTNYSFSNKLIFSGIVFFTKFFPLFLLRFLSKIFAYIFYLLLGNLRKTLEENFSLFIKEEKIIKENVKKCFFSYTKSVADFWYGAIRNQKKLFDLKEQDLSKIVKGGNILLTAHLGNWELGGIYLSQKKVPFVVFAQEEEDPYVEKLRNNFRKKFGIETYYIDKENALPFVAKRLIENNLNIILLGDRAYKKDFIPVKFFGEWICFLRSPFLLAKWLQVPIYSIFFMDDKVKYKGYIFDPILPIFSLEEMAELFSKHLEKILLQYPEQWYNFFPYVKYSKELLKK